MEKILRGFLVLLFLILISFLYQISAPRPSVFFFPSEPIDDAVQILADSGYLTMSLTLQLVSKTSKSSPITIFAPSDEVLRDSDQPSLPLLQYHFSPLKFSIENLKSLKFGTKIPTLFENHSLIVTTTSLDQDVSLNNVTINGSAIFDVGTMVVYGINKLFDTSFAISHVSTPLMQNPGDYCEIADKLIDTQYSVMGDFIDWQFLGFGDETKLTIFAPNDKLSHNQTANFSGFSFIFLRHVVPCKLTWKDLVNLEEGTELPTLFKGFKLKIAKFADVIELNGVPLVFPEVYSGETVVIHGIRQMIELNGHQGQDDSVSVFQCTTPVVPPFLDYGSGGLYCNSRTTSFFLIQVLLSAVSIGLYAFCLQYPKALMVRKYSEISLNCALVTLEATSFVLETKGSTLMLRSLTLPLACASGYVTFLFNHYYPEAKTSSHMIFDWGFLIITVEWLLYLRISDFIGESVPLWIEQISVWLFVVSFLIRHVEASFSVVQLSDEHHHLKVLLFVVLHYILLLFLALWVQVVLPFD